MRRLLVVFTLLVIFVGLLLAFLSLNPGFLTGVAVTILVIPVAIALSMAGEMLFAIPKLLSYKSYRKEWEQANADAGRLDFSDYARRRSSAS
jgi:membrane protein YdbS with pleckstrin-like domain